MIQWDKKGWNPTCKTNNLVCYLHHTKTHPFPLIYHKAEKVGAYKHVVQKTNSKNLSLCLHIQDALKAYDHSNMQIPLFQNHKPMKATTHTKKIHLAFHNLHLKFEEKNLKLFLLLYKFIISLPYSGKSEENYATTDFGSNHLLALFYILHWSSPIPL